MISSGNPEPARPILVGTPNIPDRGRFLRRVNEALDRRWLSNDGPFIREFEDRLSAVTQAAYCLTTSSGTLALDLMIRAAGLDGEVIVPSFTYIATAHAVQWSGLTPVFADVDPATGLIDPQHVEQLISPRTSAILGVHLWGRPCPVAALRRLADRHHLALLFDAAHALGSSLDGQAVGSLGDAEAFSLHATKFISAIEGGVVTTNDEGLADRVRRLRNFGFDENRDVACCGINARLNEISAAFALTSLEGVDTLIEDNVRRSASYRAGLAGVPGVTLRAPDLRQGGNHQYVVVEIDENEAAVSRDQMLIALHAENIMAQRYFYPGCHRAQPYAASPATHTPLPLPHTELLCARTLVLPTGQAVTPRDIEHICAAVRRLASGAADRTADESQVRRSDRDAGLCTTAQRNAR